MFKLESCSEVDISFDESISEFVLKKALDIIYFAHPFYIGPTFFILIAWIVNRFCSQEFFF